MPPIDPQYEHYLIARRSVEEALTPTDDQRTTLIIIGAYTAGILVLWNMPFIKYILAPFKVRSLYEKAHASNDSQMTGVIIMRRFTNTAGIAIDSRPTRVFTRFDRMLDMRSYRVHYY